MGLVDFVGHHGNRKLQESSQSNPNAKYKISLCRDLTLRRICPRGTSCTFAHSDEELEKYRAKSRKNSTKPPIINTKDAVDYLDTPSHSGLPSEETSPLRFSGVGNKSIVPQLPPQSLLPPTYMDIMPSQMHATPSPIPAGPMNPGGVPPNLVRHPYDASPYGMGYPPSGRPSMPLRSPRPLHTNFGVPPPPSPQQPPPPAPPPPPLNNQQMFHPPYSNLGNLGPSDLYSGVNVAAAAMAAASSMQPPMPQVNAQGQVPPILPSTNTAFFSHGGNMPPTDFQKIDSMRQSALWDQHRQHPSQQQQQALNINLKNPPTNSFYLNSPSNNNNNNDIPQSPILRQMYEKRRLELLKDMELSQQNKNHGLNGQSIVNNNLTKDELMSSYWMSSAVPPSLNAPSNYSMDVSNTNRDMFVRSDSILQQDDDYIPFDVPPSSSKFGPISRMTKTSVASGLTSSSQSSGNFHHHGNSGSSFQDIDIRNNAIGVPSWLYADMSSPVPSSSHKSERSPIFGESQPLKISTPEFSVSPLGSQDNFLFSKSSDVSDNHQYQDELRELQEKLSKFKFTTSQSHSSTAHHHHQHHHPQFVDNSNKYDFGLGLQLLDNKEKESSNKV